MSRTVLHIDFDSFFASVEQQDHPSLRNRPVGVIAAHSRTAIIAASKEAKAVGVRGGSNAYEARKLCPTIHLTPANFPRYFEVSKQFIGICKLYSPFLEVFSIDELFLDITDTKQLFGGTEKLIATLKAHLEKEMGPIITVSVGVSYNKLLAKLASGMRKPNGVFVITPENLDDVYKEASLTDICGIGFRIERRLKMLGIDTLLKLRQISLTKLQAEFGPHEAHFLQSVAWAHDDTPVTHFGHAPEVKSVGRNYALPKNERNQRVILQNIFELCEEIAIKLRRLGRKARTVGMSLRGTYSAHGRKTVPFYIDSGKDIFEICLLLYQQWEWDNGKKDAMVRQISVYVGNLVDSNSVPVSLFDNEKRNNGLIRTVDALNERFGDHTIRNGFLLYSAKLTTVPNGFLADRWERKELAKSYED